MILVCGGIKGGVGKTTVATNMAIMRSRQGKDVLLVDADDQGLAVVEVKPSDPKAIAEIETLYKHLFNAK